jgi:hypothetical protein
VILKRGNVFTEHGAIMAANVLNSSHAVRMSVYVVRAFIRLRHNVELQKDMMAKLEELERAVTAHDTNIKTLFAAVRQLMTPPEPNKRKIGFLVKERAPRYGRA